MKATINKTASWEIFNKIAPKYDRLNRLLSLGMDIGWRRQLSTFFPKSSEIRYLDVATGTGDVLITLLKQSSLKFKRAVGIDMAQKMLDIGQVKLKARQLDHVASLQVGDATQIPFDNQTFDVVSIAFGIRNVDDLSKGLGELYRVLDDKGRALILEFSFPDNRLLKWGYLFYLRHFLPQLGGWISGDKSAYVYLNKTVEDFPYGDAFLKEMGNVGFVNLNRKSLCFGVATIYQGDRA